MAAARPRLLCVYQHAPTPGAPGIYRHRRYFRELVRRGWAVDLVSTPRNYMSGEVPQGYRGRLAVEERIDGIDHHWVWTPGGIHRSKALRIANYGVFALAALARAALLPRPDAVLVSSPPLTVAPLGPMLARRFGCPWILEVRDIWPESAASVGWLARDGVAYRMLERLSHALTTRAALVIVPTPGLLPLVRAHGARTVVTVTGTVAERRADRDRRARARERLGVARDECVFLYLGAMGVANGLDLLLEAERRLAPDVRLRLVLAGDGSARRSLERTVDEGRRDRVTLLPATSSDDADDLLAAADVGLHLLRPDPVFASALPTKVLEYLGARLPFITTVPGLPAEVAQASGGSTATTASDLAAELARWAALPPERRRARGERALAYGLERFGLEAGVDRLDALLTETIAEPRLQSESLPA